MIKTKRQAFAEHCQLDFAETEDYRYQPSRNKGAVYAFDDQYICITKGNQKPVKKHREDEGNWKWVEVKDDFLAKFGYKVWSHKVQSE